MLTGTHSPNTAWFRNVMGAIAAKAAPSRAAAWPSARLRSRAITTITAARQGASSITLGRSQTPAPTSAPARALVHHPARGPGCARASTTRAASSGKAESASGSRKFELKARCGDSAAMRPPPMPTPQPASRAAARVSRTQPAEVSRFWTSWAAKKLRPSVP
jgi:hypothetical protein